ncbi:MAG: PfkB family carbohydrate kinase [Kiritimatiellia bacterium]
MTVQSHQASHLFQLRGANGLLAEEHFDLADSRARIFCIGYLLLLDTLDNVISPDGTTGASVLLERASALGFKTFVDAVSEDSDRFAAVVRPTLPHVDYLVINEFEASRCRSRCWTRRRNRQRFAGCGCGPILLNSGVREWVVIHWPDGAVACIATEPRKARHGGVRVPPADIVGAAGAGDAFAAGMLYGLHEGLDIRGACARRSAPPPRIFTTPPAPAG